MAWLENSDSYHECIEVGLSSLLTNDIPERMATDHSQALKQFYQTPFDLSATVTP